MENLIEAVVQRFEIASEFTTFVICVGQNLDSESGPNIFKEQIHKSFVLIKKL